MTRLETAVDGADPVSFHYLEVIRVTDPIAYQRNLSENTDEEFKAMIAQWVGYVADYAGSVGVPL